MGLIDLSSAPFPSLFCRPLRKTVSFWESEGLQPYLVAMDDSETAKPVSWTRTGAILAFLAVALGAFGAHKLKTLVGDEQLAWWETGVHYQLAHALALLILGQRALFSSGPPAAGWATAVVASPMKTDNHA